MPARSIDRRRVRELHAEGKTDIEIAAAVGCAESGAWRIRRLELMLPTASRNPVRCWSVAEEEALRRGLADGTPYAILAARLGRPVGAFSSKARRLGLLGDGRRGPEPERMSKAWSLFALGWSTRRVAAAVGVSAKHAWRYKRRMPRDWGTTRGEHP